MRDGLGRTVNYLRLSITDRVTSTGFAKSCLLADDAVDLKPYLAADTFAPLQEALRRVVAGKGQRHHLGEDEDGLSPFTMAGIGG